MKSKITKRILLVVSIMVVMLSLAGCGKAMDKPFDYNESEIVSYTINSFKKFSNVSDEYREYYMKSDDEFVKSAIKGISQVIDNDKVGTFEDYSAYYVADSGVYMLPEASFEITNAADSVSVKIINKAENRDVEIIVKYKENPEYYMAYDEMVSKELSNDFYNPEIFTQYIISQGATVEKFCHDYSEYYGKEYNSIEEILDFELENVKIQIANSLTAQGIYPYKAEEMVVNAVYSKKELMASAGKNTLIGMGTVFVVLIFISFIISLFKYLPGLFEKKPQEKKETNVTPVAKSVESEDLMNDEELVAVITAAVYAAANVTASSKDTLVVRSIKRARR